MNIEKATKWYKIAAQQSSNPWGQVAKGSCFLYGLGENLDLVQAVAWIYKAAEEGHAEGQFVYRVCFCNGVFLKNVGFATTWFRKASDQGHADAQFNLGVYFYTGNDVVKNPAEAASLFAKAANQGHAEAQWNLGVCYVNGKGREGSGDLVSKGSRPRTCQRAK